MKHTLKFIILCLCLLTSGTLTADAIDAAHFAAESRLAKGRWVKVSVEHTGIHAISHDDLRGYGFDRPEDVRVYGFGGTRLSLNELSEDLPDDLQQTESMHTADGRLLFYGEADLSYSARIQTAIDIRRNVYDLKGYYFLSDCGGDETAAASGDAVPDGARLDTHLSVGLIEREVQNVGSGGAVWHDRSMTSGDEESYTFEIRDFAESGGNGMFHYTFGAYDSKGLTMKVSEPDGLTVSRRSDIPTASLSNTNRFYAMSGGSRTFVGPVADGNYTFTLSVPVKTTIKYAAVDRAYLIYPRANRMPADGALTMCFDRVDGGRYVSVVCDADADVRLWDITCPSSVRDCKAVRDDSDPTRVGALVSTSAPASYPAIKYIAFDAGAVWPAPHYEGEVVNQNLHAMPVPQMLIITTDELRPAAVRLAELHRLTDGLDVAVVTQREVFNEFSSGSRAAMAYRLLAKMLYERDKSRFKYLLLYGHSHYDNRHPQYPSREDLLTYECEAEEYTRDRTTNYCTDAYFGMLEDDFDRNRIHFGKMSIAVSRIDVTDESGADAANAKIERFLRRGRTPSLWANVLTVSDDGDHQGHYKQSAEGMDALKGICPQMTVVQAHNLIYEWDNGRAIMLNKVVGDALAGGVGMFYYCGHATTSYFGAESLLSTALFKHTSVCDMPFAFMATCEVLPYDRATGHFGQEIFRMPEGGAVATIGPARTAIMEYNQTMTLAFLREYASAGFATTIGDIYMRAHNAAVSKTSEPLVAVNAMSFNMHGDPSLRVGAPSSEMVIDDVDGVSADGEGRFVVNPLTKIRIRGRVSGDEAATFSGKGLVKVYETPRTVYTDERTDKNEKPQPVVLDEELLTARGFEIKDGRFDFETMMPEPLSPGGPNRVTLSAVSADRLCAASGMSVFAISESDAGVADGDAPVIEEFYVGDDDFADGDVIGSTTTVFARISGDVAAGRHIGRRMTMSLDGRVSLHNAGDYVSMGDDGTVTVEMPLSKLSPGRHSLTLVAYSASGASAERTIGFICCESSASLRLSVGERPATKVATISLSHDFTGTPDCRLIIENDRGETVFSREGCVFPYEWRLVTSDGRKADDGLYRAFVTATDGLERGSSDKIEIVVIGDTQ